MNWEQRFAQFNELICTIRVEIVCHVCDRSADENSLPLFTGGRQIGYYRANPKLICCCRAEGCLRVGEPGGSHYGRAARLGAGWPAAAQLLSARAEAGGASRGSAAGSHQRPPQLLPGHGQRTAPRGALPRPAKNAPLAPLSFVRPRSPSLPLHTRQQGPGGAATQRGQPAPWRFSCTLGRTVAPR